MAEVVIPALPPSIFDRIGAGVRRKVTETRRRHAQHRLEKDVAGILETTNAHKARKVVPGAEVYKTLHAQADMRVEAFCTKHQVDKATILQQMPALKELEALTHPVTLGNRVSQGVSVLVMFALGALGLGVGLGLVALGYRLLVH